ncbi:MAG: hypothetical protein LC700_00280 [Actinobacteria bacterium]|nr:hypothetical protein [Actinomycetota bacterium]
MKNVGKPCDREGHARIDGRELETEQTSGHGHGEERSAGNRAVTNGPAPYRRPTPPRQLSTLLGRFYKSMLYPLLRRINDHLVRWAMRKYKRLRRREQRARELMVEASRRSPQLFAHWRFGLKPAGWTMGAV